MSVEATEKLIQLLEEQLAFMKQQNQELSKKLDASLAQNKYLSEQVRQLTKMIYGHAQRSQNTKHPMDIAPAHFLALLRWQSLKLSL